MRPLEVPISAKLNIRKQKPHRNRRARRSEREAWLGGFAVALAEMHRHGSDSAGVCAVARGAGLTLKEARDVGVDAFDLKELKRAGVKSN